MPVDRATGRNYTDHQKYGVRPLSEFVETYRKIGDPEDRFDIDFWQAQGPGAIFQAALELVLDAQLVKNGYADEPRIQRTVESFQKL